MGRSFSSDYCRRRDRALASEEPGAKAHPEKPAAVADEAATRKAKVASRGSLQRDPNGTFVACVSRRNALTDRIKKAGRHVSQNEGLIFEQSAPGKRGVEFPPLDVPAVDARTALGA